MKVLNAVVLFADRMPARCPAIEHEGEIWLAPSWLPLPDGKGQSPIRIISLDRVPVQKSHDGLSLVVDDALPKQLFETEIPQELRNNFRIVERPNILMVSKG